MVFFFGFLFFVYFAWDGLCPRQQSTLEAKHLINDADSLHSENIDMHKLTFPSPTKRSTY
jgi:hypothetical protein